MSLIKWNPEHDFAGVQRRINRIFDDFFGGGYDTDRYVTGWSPLVDIKEENNAFVLHAEIPGVRKDGITLTVNNNTLTIRGEKKQESESKNANFYRIERSFGAFERSFTLPQSIASEKIEAAFENGVLTITLPKSEAAKPKEIPVR